MRSLLIQKELTRQSFYVLDFVLLASSLVTDQIDGQAALSVINELGAKSLLYSIEIEQDRLALSQVDAPDIEQKSQSESRSNPMRRGFLWRLALSEVFNGANVDTLSGSRRIRSWVSPLKLGQGSSNQAEMRFGAKYFLGILGLGVWALAAFSLLFLGGLAEISHQKLDGAWITPLKEALSIFPFHYPFTESSHVLWRFLLLLGGLGIVLLLFRRLVFGIGRMGEIGIFVFIAITFAAGVKAYTIMEASFEAQAQSPRLSHIVIQPRSFLTADKYNDDKLRILDQALGKEGFGFKALKPSFVIGDDAGLADEKHAWCWEKARVDENPYAADEQGGESHFKDVISVCLSELLHFLPWKKGQEESASQQPVDEEEGGEQRFPFAYGRYDIMRLPLARLRSPIPDSERLDSTKHRALCPVLTSSNPKIAYADAMAVSLNEPMIARLTYLQGKTMAGLRRGAMPDIGDMKWQMLDGSNNGGILVTRQLLARLGYENDQPLPRHLCIELFGKKEVVRVISVVESLPNDGTSDYHVLMRASFYKNRYNRQGEEDDSGIRRNIRPVLTTYDKAAVYIDKNRMHEFVDVMEEISRRVDVDEKIDLGCGKENRRNTLACKVEDLGIRQAISIRAETGFEKIKQAIQMGDLFKAALVAVLFAFAVFTILLTIRILSAYITQNERSLCVMRAFGARWRQIMIFIGMQLLIMLLPGIVIAGGLAFFLWPAFVLEQQLPDLLGIPAQAVLFGFADVTRAVAALVAVLFVGCLWAVSVWWWQSRWVGERLKLLG